MKELLQLLVAAAAVFAVTTPALVTFAMTTPIVVALICVHAPPAAVAAVMYLARLVITESRSWQPRSRRELQ